jgi:Ca-activated chloride channel family protein
MRFRAPLQQPIGHSKSPNSGTDLCTGLGWNSLLDSDPQQCTGTEVTDGVLNLGLPKEGLLDLLEQQDVRLFTFVMEQQFRRPMLENMAKVSNGFTMTVSNGIIAGKLLEAESKASTRGICMSLQMAPGIKGSVT